MRAAVCTRYGPPEVLQIRDVRAPVPGKRDVLVRVRAAAVNVSDLFARSGIPTAPLVMRAMLRLVFGIRRPRRGIPGLVLAGEVAETGRSVTRFRAGDRVYAFTGFRFGACAEFAVVRESGIVARAPSGLAWEEAAAIPYGGLLALHALRKATIRPGDPVLVYGASGAIGSAAVQIARHLGAEVTAACGPANAELVRSLGAGEVLDYTTSDDVGGRRYAFVLDAVGRRKTSRLKTACKAALLPGGAYVSVDDDRPRFGRDDLVRLTEMAEAGALRPVLDRTYPLEEIAEAHRYVEEGHKRGNVVVTIG